MMGSIYDLQKRIAELEAERDRLRERNKSLEKTNYIQAGVIRRLREEVRVLRLYGDKDCTAMADKDLAGGEE